MHYFKKGSVVKFNTKSKAIPNGNAQIIVLLRDKSGKIASRVATGVSLAILDAYNQKPLVAKVSYIYKGGDVLVKVSDAQPDVLHHEALTTEFRISRIYLKPDFFKRYSNKA